MLKHCRPGNLASRGTSEPITPVFHLLPTPWWCPALVARNGLELDYPRAELRGRCSVEYRNLGAWRRPRRRIIHSAVVGVARWALGVAAISVVVLVRGMLVIVVVSIAARGLRWRGLVDGRLEVEVWTKSGLRSRRREGRAHHGRAWRIERVVGGI